MLISHVMSGLGDGEGDMGLARVLSRLSNKYNFELIAPKRNKLFSLLDGTRVKLTPMKLHEGVNFSITDVYILSRHFRASMPYVIHSHTSLSARIGGLISGVERLISSKDENVGIEMGHIAGKLYERATLLTVSNSAIQKQLLRKRGIPDERIVDLPFGVGEEIQEVAGETEEQTFKILAHLPRGEDVSVVVSAVANLKRRYKISISILTEGEAARDALRLAALFGISKIVDVKDAFSVNAADYTCASAFIYRGRENESLSPLLYRAMSYGLVPILPAFSQKYPTSEFGGAALFYSSFDTFSLSSCISRLLDSPNTRKEIGKTARKIWRDGYSEERMISAYDNFYSALLTR